MWQLSFGQGYKIFLSRFIKAIKKLNQFVYKDLIRSINLVGFLSKRYFFMFTDNVTKMTEIYTEIKTNN